MDTIKNPPSDPLRVLFLAAEADPLVKVGGLGDVAGSLPQALRSISPSLSHNRGLDVRLVIPFHGIIDPTGYRIQRIGVFPVTHTPEAMQAEAFSTEINGVPVYLIAGPPIIPSAPVYSQDAHQDGVKYTFFSLAALELARVIGWSPDILHANDWHSALAIYALHLRKDNDQFFNKTHTLLTVHNLPFMGVGAESALAEFGLPPAQGDSLPDWARQVPLALGLLAADWVVAVSPTYAKEIQTPDFGCGLDQLLRGRAGTLSGIMNGIDTNIWDPRRDPHGIVNYSEDDLEIRGMNKTAIQGRYSLPQESDIPLMTYIGRMDPQKGVDILLDVLGNLTDLPWQIILLGTGLPTLEEKSRMMDNDFPDRVRSIIRFDSRVAHQLYSAGDLLIMPSRYEPCGLAQMIAMRYGCIPVAHATGGLKDTILDSTSTVAGTGILYENNTPVNLETALRRALASRTNPSLWRQIQLNGMKADFSWDKPALEYSDLYFRLMESQQ